MQTLYIFCLDRAKAIHFAKLNPAWIKNSMRFLYLLLLLSEWFFEGFAPKPGPPTDLRILPLSNTELDVDIYPPDTGNKVGG